MNSVALAGIQRLQECAKEKKIVNVSVVYYTIMQSRISCTQGWPKHHNLSLSMRQDLSIPKRLELRINTVDISHPALANWCWLSFSQYCQTRVWQRCLFEVLISVPVLRVYESRSYVNLAVNNMNTSVNSAIDPLVWKKNVFGVCSIKFCCVYVVAPKKGGLHF